MRILGDVKQFTSAADAKLVTPKEMAEILRCSPPQVLRLMRAGIIPIAFSVGRLHRFDASAVLEALGAHKPSTEAHADK